MFAWDYLTMNYKCEWFESIIYFKSSVSQSNAYLNRNGSTTHSLFMRLGFLCMRSK